MVAERRWHPSQEIEWKGRNKETLEMKLELSSFEEISRWILSWGPQVEVIEPNELKASIIRSLDESRKLYHG